MPTFREGGYPDWNLEAGETPAEGGAWAPGLLSVRGFVAHAETGAGLGDLRVELWPVGGEPGPLAVARSDESGAFRLRVPRQRFGEAIEAEVDVRVLDRGRVRLGERRRLSLAGAPEPLELTVPETLWDATGEAAPSPGEVWGRVEGRIPEGATVEAVLETLAGGALDERVVATSSTNDAGWFRLRYERPASAADCGLLVRLRGPHGALLAESVPVLAPPASARIDLRAPRAAGPSEYALLEQRLGAELAAGVGALDGLAQEAVAEVADWLDLEPDTLALLQTARRLEAETGIPGAVFYALGRGGLATELEALADVPVHELRVALEDAIADGVICARLLPELDALTGRLAEVALERAVAPGAGAGRPALALALEAAGVPAESVRRVLRARQQWTGPEEELWESLAQPGGLAEELGEEAAGEIRVAAELAALVGPDARLLGRLHELRRQGRWHDPEDLTRLSFEDWCGLLEELEGGEGGLDEEARAAVEEDAGAILEALEEAFPSEFIRRELVETESLGAGARRILEQAGNHDLLTGSIRARVSAEPGLLAGLSEEEAAAAVEEIEAIERLSRVTPYAEEVALLAGTGLRSATEIGAMPRGHFVRLYADALGGRPRAARLHAEAQQVAAASKLALVGLLQAEQQTPFVLRGAVDPALKDIPDARTLFGSASLCGCQHCRSVYSPAAYFVDLLRYLNVTDPERLEQIRRRLAASANPPSAASLARLGSSRPLDELLRRRPDLAELPLTCENTQTPLPYIDLVNELLEARVTGGSAAFDTGKVPADVLRAVPQNVSVDAYRRLQEAVHPLSLPFHLPLAVTRAYLGHLGVSRLELLRTFGPGPAADPAALAGEALGMSPEELALVVRPPVEPWRQLGFAAEAAGGVRYLDVVAHAPALIEAAGITFRDLIDLVGTRFVNADQGLALEAAGLDCDPAKVRLAGLDDARLSRMLRMIRLRRRLGWSYADLDRALAALGATDLDGGTLARLVEVQELARRLDRPVPELLVLWAPIDGWGEDSQFARLLNTRAVAWRTQDARTFTLRQPDRAELETTGPTLDPVASALLAAFRITSEELATIRALLDRRGAAPKLDLGGLSAVYRVVVLGRALRLRFDQLDLLLRLAPPEADPFRAGDPAAARRFVELVREVQDSDFTPEKLAYLFRHESEAQRDPAPAAAEVRSVLAGIRRGLADAFAETSHPAEVAGETLRGKLAMLLDPALLDQAVEVLDPRTPLTAAQRRQFFDRHLARVFPDPAGAAARLFDAPAAAASPEPSEAAAPAGDERFRANALFVLDHLLPLLRARRTRGAVVQALSDSLGLSHASIARLIDDLLRSRRARGEPLVRDFLALLGAGLTGAYYASAELGGEPAVVRTDPELSFSWAGAPPAPGVPGRQFGARWIGHLLPRSKAPHTFYLRTDGAVRLVIKTGDVERVLIDQPAAAAVAEHASEPVALDPDRLHEIRLEYRNQGAPAVLSLQYGTAPGSKQPIPTTDLYPAGGLTSFAPVELAYRRLHKAALLLGGFGASDAQLEWLAAEPRFLDLDALPMEPGDAAAGTALFGRWRQLARLFALRKKLPRSAAELFDVLRARDLPEAVERLVLATGWDRGVVEALIGPQGFALAGVEALRPAADPAEEPLLVRLARAVELQRRVGVTPQTLFGWTRTPPDADTAAAVVQAVKARYDEKRWLEVARTLNDPLRAERRDALVAYLLPRLRAEGVRSRDQLFEYLLIDVDMNPCMLTSRVRQAIATVQTFFQRCLMNLEPKVHPRLIDDNDWKWLKSYRVWEANRKVFLYPENWIEPELRDDKSPQFEELERTILQQEIKKENVEAAFATYLEQLDEISRLDVRAVWFERREGAPALERRRAAPAAGPQAPRNEWEHGTYHVFARTFNAPHVWYYRRLEQGHAWTPWQRIEADIEGDHLVPVIFHRRLHLFWTVFREASKPPPTLEREDKGPPPKAAKDWEIHLAYVVFDRGRWSRKRMSSGGAKDVTSFVVWDSSRGGAAQTEGSTLLSPADYTLRATVTGAPAHLELHLYRRKLDRVRTTQMTARRPALEATEVEKLARFELDGCNGELVLVPEAGARVEIVGGLPHLTRGHARGRVGGRRRRPATPVQPAAPGARPFQLATGGRLDVPAGYRVHGMAFAPTRAGGGALLTLRGAGRTGVALAAPRARAKGVRIVPVVDPAAPAADQLFPLFFQDRLRSYFARPVYTGYRPPRLVAVPLVGRRAQAQAPRFGRRNPGPARARPAAPAGRRREELESEALDAWEAEQDEAWMLDDVAERRPRPRGRAQPARRPTGAPPQPRPTAAPPPVRVQQVAGYHEQKLRFVPFEHPATCRFLTTLRARGIDGLLDFATTRPRRGEDHELTPDGQWRRRSPTWFERRYAPGPLVDLRRPPVLDVEFEADNPYALYNWELFFHAPLQVAIRLAKDGRHEEAQRWFHFIFDPTTDASSPSPKRYWRFPPFHDNTEYAGARELMALLSYGGKDDTLLRRQHQVIDQLHAWWEKPFSPHVIARMRIAAYQKAVVMKYIDNLIEWGDKLFRRDTMESIQEATQLYILAANILGPRPERIPPLADTEPLTFAKMRGKLDVFANFELRLENLQVRRPFRVAARPEVGAASSILGMATQYFCTPGNPNLDRYWDTVADRLFKIRNCMNIQGVVRQLPLFEPPIDPGLLVRAAAAGVDLGSVISGLNAPLPPHRFRVQLARAVRLAEEIRGFGAMTLQVLERRDAEELAALRASHESTLLEAIREIRKKQVRQVEEELAELSVERERVAVEVQHVNDQLAQLMNPQENAKQIALTAMQVVSGVAEGVDLVSKVLYAIPDFQTGAAGAFSSPFVTLQIGGQMFGDVSAAFAASLEKVLARNETDAELAAAQAEYQRRREEWQHQLELLGKEKAQVDKRIAETQLKLEIASAELRRHDLEVDNARKVESFLRDKYTNQQLYGWMLGQLSSIYFQAYKVAFDAARQAERAFRFERGDPSASFIEFSYWDSLKKGLFAGERLLGDLRRLESAYLEGDRRALEITRHLSLRQEDPLALQELLATGRCKLEVTEALLDGDFPGHYFRRIKAVSLTMVGAFGAHANVNCTLTLLENRIRTDANASGAYAAREDDGGDARFLVNFAPVQAVATSRPGADPGLFELRFDDDRYLPFEGAGAVSTWRLELHQADNAVDLGALDDVVLTLAYTARSGGGALEAAARAGREKALGGGGLKPAPRHMISVRRDLPALWQRLAEEAAGKEVDAALPLERLSGRLRGLDVRIERVAAFARGRAALPAGALRVRVDPPRGTGATLADWTRPWPGSWTVRAGADLTGPPGAWKLAVTAGGKLPDLVDDLVLVFDLRARKA